MQISFQYLRPKKAALLKERYRLYETTGNAAIQAYDDAVVVPGYRDSHNDLICGVIGKNGRFVEESHCVDFPDEVSQYCSSLTVHDSSDEAIVYMGYFNSHWGHFITDCLSMFWCVKDLEVKKYVFSCDENERPHIHPNIRQALTLLGVWENIEFQSRPCRYRKVYVPVKGMIPRDYVLEQCREVYDTIIRNALAEQSAGDYPEKLILSRAAFPKARLNEPGIDGIERIFLDNGYQKICPEQLSLSQLIGYLAHASEVITFSGTLAHNMLFAPEGSNLTVLERYANINNYQQGIDRLKNLNVVYVDTAWLVRPVSPGLGPFLLGMTDQFRSYLVHKGLVFTESPVKGRLLLRKFFRLFKRHYGRQWIMPEWIEPEISLLGEAYNESLTIFGKYLKGKSPIFVSDALAPRFLAKKIVGTLKSLFTLQRRHGKKGVRQ